MQLENLKLTKEKIETPAIQTMKPYEITTTIIEVITKDEKRNKSFFLAERSFVIPLIAKSIRSTEYMIGIREVIPYHCDNKEHIKQVFQTLNSYKASSMVLVQSVFRDDTKALFYSVEDRKYLNFMRDLAREKKFKLTDMLLISTKNFISAIVAGI